MTCFEKLFIWVVGLFLPLLALADSPGGTGYGMMHGWMMPGMGIMGIVMLLLWLLLVVLLVLAILALIKYLRKK